MPRRTGCLAHVAARSWSAWVVGGVAALALVGCTEAPSQLAARRDVPVPGRAFAATVERVVDGDTLIAVARGERLRVRLIGVDAPESVRPGYPVECWGRKSSAVLESLVPPDSQVYATYQPGGRRDRFGRELWDVWLPDGTLLQAELVQRGAAEAVSYEPQTAYSDLLEAAETRARAAGRGLHAACP